MDYIYALDRLLTLAEEETTVGEIGGMLCHSREYDELYDLLVKALSQVETEEN